MTDNAKLRELMAYRTGFNNVPAVPKPDWLDPAIDYTGMYLTEYLDLLESSDIILIRKDAEGNWPEALRSVIVAEVNEGEPNPLFEGDLLAIQILNALAESLKGAE